jgi:hypothetical protein
VLVRRGVAFRHPNGSKPTWTTSQVDAHNVLQVVSWPTTSLCVAVDGKGNVVTSTTRQPARAAGTSPRMSTLD